MNQAAPRVTWLMPVRNAMPYLPQTLESIHAQAYLNHELLVWENGSTDGTLEELQRWIPNRIPGRIITGKPLSVGNSRAELVRLAETDLCACLDGDDIALPNRLATQVQFLEKHPEVAAVGSQVIRIDKSSAAHGQYEILPLNHDDIVHRMLWSWTMWQPSMLFRRPAVLDVGNYRDIRHEDYDLWLRLAARYRLANLPDCLIHYRVHGTNLTTAIPEQEAARDLRRAYIEAAPALFGCTQDEATILYDKRGFFVFPKLQRIASHLARQLGGTQSERLHNPTFLDACEKVVRRRDFLSRFLISRLRASAST